MTFSRHPRRRYFPLSSLFFLHYYEDDYNKIWSLYVDEFTNEIFLLPRNFKATELKAKKKLFNEQKREK